jgi:hypothetical protein
MKEYVGALYALDNGWKGQGVTIGVIDDGLDATNQEFTGRVSSLSKDFGNVVTTNANGTTSSSARNSYDNPNSTHGTAIAGVIGANRNGVGIVGLAPEVSIAVLRVDDTTSSGEGFPTSNAAKAIAYARDNAIKIINRSMATVGQDATLSHIMETYAAVGGLVINAAGNSGGANPEDAVNVTAANRAAWLFVGAIDTTGTDIHISSYSNRAGTMMDRFVVAPGDNVTVLAGGNGATTVMSGTSLAAPVVAGLAATIASKWPQLTGQQVGDIILNTATDIGAPGVDAVYGHGLVNFKAALSPVDPTLSNGSTSTSVQSSIAVVPTSMGTTSIQTALSNVTVLDSYGRDFQASLSNRVVSPRQSMQVGGLVRQMAAQQGAGFGYGPIEGHFSYSTYHYAGDRQNPDALRAELSSGFVAGRLPGGMDFSFGIRQDIGANGDFMGLAPNSQGHAAYAPQATNTFSMGMTEGTVRFGVTGAQGGDRYGRASVTGVDVRTRNSGLRFSVVDEIGSVMGMPSSGALQLGRGATTLLLEADRSFSLAGGWSAHLYGSVGRTTLKIASQSLVTGSSPIVATRFGLTVDGPVGGGRMSVGLAQPLTVESGSARLHVASGYDLGSQSLVYSDRTASLRGDRREYQLSAGYERQVGRYALRLGVSRNMVYGDTGAALSYGLAF